MSDIKKLDDYQEISFIDNISIENIQKEYKEAMKEKYKELTGNELSLQDTDPISLIADANCLMLYQIAQYADRAGKMSLLKYSYGDYLENIGALKGICRIQGATAKTRLRFILSAKRPGVTLIPAGTRVTAADGVYFSTVEVLEIPAGVMTGEVNAECREIGAKGNGYKEGDLNVIVDPVPYVDKAENLTVTEGGADIESDASLAERIYLAPSAWSTAGPDDAYSYWVRTYNQAITDVRVLSEIPGEVDIYFLLQEGMLPEGPMCEELEQYLQSEKIRPLTDHVNVRAPKVQMYNIDLTYYINKSDKARAPAIQAQVENAVKEYIAWQKEKIGRDINPDQLCKKLILAGAKRLEIRNPDFRKISQESVALLNGEPVVLYGGMEDD